MNTVVRYFRNDTIDTILSIRHYGYDPIDAILPTRYYRYDTINTLLWPGGGIGSSAGRAEGLHLLAGVDGPIESGAVEVSERA